MPATMTNKKLTWTCDHCNKPISPGDTGYVCVDDQAALRAEAAWAETGDSMDVINGAVVMAQLITENAAARWSVTHHKCDPNPDGGYWIGANRLTTLRELLEMNEHLMEKSWVAMHTDWPAWLTRTLG
ncbi:MAG: hypothetical protein JWL72_3842 [Ilumatobacteraceae bacterium]|nr:hypothetical protein [Ilumatobacteraceae bacterium]